ncbi:MAG: hypothetical protein NUW37_10475 [Planctomycetes bacterium]|nr:hypothetical protein [Planctomycetota bacterium]
MSDEIIREVWRNREALSKKYGNNLDAIIAAIREAEAKSTRKLVSKPRKRRVPQISKDPK